MILLQLFWSFFQVGLFSIGGGLAAMPFIQQQIVSLHHWLSLSEFTDLVTIAEMTPGPIAINAATFVGIRIAGIPGALLATFGCILPSILIVSLLSWVYYRFKNLGMIQAALWGLRPAIIALIANAGFTILNLTLWNASSFNWIGACLASSAFLILRKWKPNPIIVMLGCGVLGGILYLLF